MKKKKKVSYPQIFLFFILLVLAVIYFFPIYLVLVNSVKPYAEIFTSSLSLPKQPNFENYINTWKTIDYPRNFLNSLIVTGLTAVLVTFVASMAAYKLSRIKTKLSAVLFFIFISSMLVPSQVTMVPVVRMAKFLHIKDSLIGLSIITAAGGLSMAIFLYHGFIKGIPTEIDEAARIDGCGEFRTFLIIFRLLTPIMTTSIILNVLSTWNDFLMPLLLLTKEDVKTLPLMAFSFITKFNSQWDKQLASVVMVGVPMILFYLVMQKYIVRGITEGAVKG